MAIDLIFIGFVESIAKDALKHGIREAFRAMVEQEINETDLNRVVSEPFLSAHDHLKDAMIQTDNVSRQREHLENARLKFVQASNTDAPLPAARAAFYVGVCYKMLGESGHELSWYERSLQMFSDMEQRLTSKLARVKPVTAATMIVPFPFDLATVAYKAVVIANLNSQLKTVREQKNAVQDAIAPGNARSVTAN